ncbi:ABC transporter permease [Paenibacillus yanchengensis]|uniref:ABC transporter permease n=1 Tax=Paenibacillus yanchengensis TaxID=2035833 RepID=A0ABW4YJ90_9BACL
MLKRVARHWELYLLLVPVLAFFIIFHYWPMYGVQIAFKNFSPLKGIMGSDWVGLYHFERFFDSFFFSRLFWNTIGISVYELLVGFPIPIILALMINEVRSSRFKKVVQTVTYAPHFLSTVVLVGMLVTFLSPTSGVINHILALFGIEPVSFMTEASWFKTLFVSSSIWQNAGWSSIIYIAALTNIDPQMHEAAMIDGAGRMKRIWHINIPGIMPTMIILFVLNIGSLMNVGFEKIFLMQNDLNMEASDVFATYVYRSGVLGAQYSFASAVGLFNSLVNVVLLFTVNRAAKRISGSGLF